MEREKFEWPVLDVLELSDDIILTSGDEPATSKGENNQSNSCGSDVCNTDNCTADACGTDTCTADDCTSDACSADQSEECDNDCSTDTCTNDVCDPVEDSTCDPVEQESPCSPVDMLPTPPECQTNQQ